MSRKGCGGADRIGVPRVRVRGAAVRGIVKLVRPLCIGGLLAILAAVLIYPGAMRAEGLSAPDGPVILTISGEITVTNADGRAEFDREMLEALPQTAVRTLTPWTDDQVVFEGVLMRDLLAFVGSRGETVKATALNDYAVSIPVSDFEEETVILAIKRNGDYMPVRENGPLWIIYPLCDDLTDLDTHSKMVWQLRWIEVRRQ